MPGLRHLAFEANDVPATAAQLQAKGIPVEPIRIDPLTSRQFTFFADPDGLPLELYEAAKPSAGGTLTRQERLFEDLEFVDRWGTGRIQNVETHDLRGNWRELLY